MRSPLDKIFLSHSVEETEAWATAYGERFSQTPSIFALYGELGSGKTAFTRGLCKSVNIPPRQVTSPTFTYLNIYGETSRWPIYHFDLYRIRSCDAFQKAGFLEYMNTPAWCVIEWAERVSSLLPPHTHHLYFEHLSETERKIYEKT